MATNTVTSATPTGTCGSAAQYELPVKDAACGIPNNSKYKPLIEDCAKPAGVLTYNHDCALYGLAIDQSVQKLTDCLYDAGVAWEDVWCHGATNATATATSYPTATATGSRGSKSNSSTSAASSTSTSGSTQKSAATTLGDPNGKLNIQSVLVASTLFASAVLCAF